MKGHIGPIIKQIGLLSFTYSLYCFGISETQQLTTWDDINLQLIALKSSIVYASLIKLTDVWSVDIMLKN